MIQTRIVHVLIFSLVFALGKSNLAEKESCKVIISCNRIIRNIKCKISDCLTFTHIKRMQLKSNSKRNVHFIHVAMYEHYSYVRMLLGTNIPRRLTLAMVVVAVSSRTEANPRVMARKAPLCQC